MTHNIRFYLSPDIVMRRSFSYIKHLIRCYFIALAAKMDGILVPLYKVAEKDRGDLLKQFEHGSVIVDCTAVAYQEIEEFQRQFPFMRFINHTGKPDSIIEDGTSVEKINGHSFIFDTKHYLSGGIPPQGKIGLIRITDTKRDFRSFMRVEEPSGLEACLTKILKFPCDIIVDVNDDRLFPISRLILFKEKVHACI